MRKYVIISIIIILSITIKLFLTQSGDQYFVSRNRRDVQISYQTTLTGKINYTVEINVHDGNLSDYIYEYLEIYYDDNLVPYTNFLVKSSGSSHHLSFELSDEVTRGMPNVIDVFFVYEGNVYDEVRWTTWWRHYIH